MKKVINIMHFLLLQRKFRKNSLVLTNEGMGDKSNLTVSIVKNNILKEIFVSKKIELEHCTK